MLQCEGLQFSMFFDLQMNIREHAHIIEERLKELFPAGFMTLPDPGPNAPAEIPRILGNGNNNRTQLVITNVSTKLSYIKFDQNESIEELLKNFSKDTHAVYETIIDFTPAKNMNYCGLAVLLRLPDVPNGNDFIQKKFLSDAAKPKWEHNEKYYDTAVVYTLTQDEKYYINLSLSSAHEIVTDKSVLRVQIDVNDKYRFSPDVNDELHFSEKDIDKKLFAVCKNVLQNQVTNLVGE